MNNTRILLLCNNIIAIPAMRELVFYNQVAAIIIPSSNKELIATVNQLLEGAPVPVIPVNKKDFIPTITDAIQQYKVAAAVMMTFPYMIPESLFTLPPKGFINFHYGRLPAYRGPEPIFAQVSLQEKNPGLTVHIVTSGIDDGPIILQESFPFNPDDTYGLLREKLSQLGAKLINLLMKILSFGKIIPAIPQDETKAVYHKKPVAANLMINWQEMNSAEIRALVNACNPWNKGCGARINGQVIGITAVEILDPEDQADEQPGTIVLLDEMNGLQVAAKDKKRIKITIVYTEEGFFTGHTVPGQLLSKGQIFNS